MSLPRTIDYLKRNMGAVFMEFLNRVGENSKPNGFPLAFGKSIELVDRSIVGLPPMDPDWDRDKICQEYLDKYDYHLHQFGAHGYKTMIAQDHLAGIVFYPNCSGFKNLEADHVWRSSKNCSDMAYYTCSL
ncbi:hypothetical protein NECAME_16211 [Necator americanus]|uniref:Uncharacterized protein n=1 Tax=Necator americanus TaxID=51031 RepID=W2TXQ8_NECAM|nr:hypothetical protein NECAME_16211 [Necator americanus]ETN86653.1 hypothetical protein NECAME_16211 [Necator americanus]